MKLINIGFGNMVASSRLIAIVSPESAPVKRTVQEARDRGMVVDGTYGRRTRAVLIMDSDHVVLLDDETKETDVQRAAFESDVLRGVVMSEVLTRPSERAALRRMKRGRRA